MSTLAYYEPHKFSAGALALIVHAIFFTLLYFGFNWHVKPPQGMIVDMWDKLPDVPPEIVPAPLPPPPELPKVEAVVAPKVVEPVAPVKAEIEYKDKKKKKKNEKIKKEAPPVKAQPKQDGKAWQKELEIQQAAAARAAREDERAQSLQAKMRAEMDAATQGEVAKYKDLISDKIKRNKINPPDLAENSEAIFLITVLPGGTVTNVKLEKSSGNAAYDSAAERAIHKAEPLPMPQDTSVARMFRELRLSVKP